ncbi:thiamine pyrophosphate-binding protein [Rhizobium leguminosarum]|uniref:thiamine pyrophosphate-binding protein n=1 Tax=Rhizobium leguminosarum TaxID=384 RepID=UPI0014424573
MTIDLRHRRYLLSASRQAFFLAQSRIFAPHNWNRSELLFVSSIGLLGTNLESYCEAAERQPHPRCGITALLRTNEGTPSMAALRQIAFYGKGGIGKSTRAAQCRKRKVKGSDLFVRELENQGVERIFYIPGEETLDLLESLRTSRIGLSLNRMEQGAIYMAANYGRLTGKTGVCLATLGPGALNFANGAEYARINGIPLLMIAGQKPIKNRRQAGFQRSETVPSMKHLTKLAIQIPAKELIVPTLREALRVTQEGKAGPVLIELAEDIAAEECEEFR